MSLNVHHLELFYYVAKYGGITEAVRKMPYGIQQPAVSGQILQLEKHLGVKLFRRRPFALTPSGENLYNFVYPFFSGLDQVASRLKGEESQHLRLTASAMALTHHLPRVLERIRSEYPGLRLTLREVPAAEVEAALQKQETDVAIAVLPYKTAPGIKALKLLELPLVVLAPPGSDQHRFAALTKRAVGGQIREPLISLPAQEKVAQLFQAGLAQRNLVWEPSMEVSELSLIGEYVANGFGWGVTLDIPGVELPGSVMKVRLPGDFSPLVIGALHHGDLKPVAARFVEIARAYAQEISIPGDASEKK